MTPEQIALLSQFHSRLDVGMACYHTFGQQRHFAVPTWVCEAVKAGHLELWTRDGDSGPVIDSPKIYAREFTLTSAGRIACGLMVAPVEKKRERTLF